jgi:hypothetical protein
MYAERILMINLTYYENFKPDYIVIGLMPANT